jgi:hypothetical protein
VVRENASITTMQTNHFETVNKNPRESLPGIFLCGVPGLKPGIWGNNPESGI